jgi:hypothetical protein
MDHTTNRTSNNRRPTSSERSCPLCREQLRESQYPRHGITLADESDAAPNQRVNGRLCRDCWDALYTSVAAAD